MIRVRTLAIFLLAFDAFSASLGVTGTERTQARRLVILKVDGIGADLLYGAMREWDPATNKSRLPWLSHIFGENGVVFENFYTRGISLSAPSWSMLDTGRPLVIRGNVEYDRFTGHVYDYLNFFPFYIGYARARHVDMPGVEVLERAGIPLVMDAFPFNQTFQGFQLFQRGVRWQTLESVLKRRFSGKILISMLENAGTPSLDELLARQTEDELDHSLEQRQILYLDFFTGDLDHQGHATNEAAALLRAMQSLDSLAGRIWSAIEKSPLQDETLFVIVSDHGMNNVPGVTSQSFSLPDLLNSPAGGAHHVVTDRHQLSEYKLRGLNPLVQRVTSPSTASFYLGGERAHYPTAWLDLDGNERASVQLRNSDLNKIHILLLQLARADLQASIRNSVATYLSDTLDRHRAVWSKTVAELSTEMSALTDAIEKRKREVDKLPKNWTAEQHERGTDKAARRLIDELDDWQHEREDYTGYLKHLRALIAFEPDKQRPFRGKISDLVLELSLGESNTVADLQHYVVGPASANPVVDASGNLDVEHSFRFVDYFSLLVSQRVRNNPQPQLSPRPVDFTAMSLSGNLDDPRFASSQNAYWLYGDEDSQLLILVAPDGRIALRPVSHFAQDEKGAFHWTSEDWRPGFPLHLFEDAQLSLPHGLTRAGWLSQWHNEREWFDAIHMCRYSNGVIGVTEELSPVGRNVPGRVGISPVLLRYERRRRQLVQADFQVFAADHWNFNVRNFNPGGNHGSFLRISTHSVWMMAGAGLTQRSIGEPYDSLNFASTILSLVGHTPPLPNHIVTQ